MTELPEGIEAAHNSLRQHILRTSLHAPLSLQNLSQLQTGLFQLGDCLLTEAACSITGLGSFQQLSGLFQSQRPSLPQLGHPSCADILLPEP
ncbi:hypothetical protein D3C76_1558310 [compost metagenome]